MQISLAFKTIVVGMALSVLGCSSSTGRLISQLGDADPKVRRAAARALAERAAGRDEVVAALSVAASRDEDAEVRELAVSALGSLGPEAASKLPVLQRSLDDPELSVRVAAALAIQKVDPDNDAFAPVLLESLRAGHGPVFLEVGRMGADAKWAVPTLAKLLSDRRPTIRALAAQTLGEIGVAASDAESSLQRSLRDPEPSVRRAVQRAREQIQSQPAAAR